MPESESSKPTSTIYDWTALGVFLANATLMAAASLLYLYADFVEVAGGTEFELGWIVGIGMAGAIGFRVFQSVAIDRIGIRSLWLTSLIIFILGTLWHTQLTSVTTWQVYAARLLVASGVAGSLGCWLTFTSLRVPQERIAEVIGVIGTSGFVGMAIGPTIGDYLLRNIEPDLQSIDRLFYTAAGLAVASLVIAFIVTNAKVQRKSNGQHRPWEAIKNTKLGFLLVIGITMGMAASIPSTFVRPFVSSVGIESVAIYFWTYNIVACTCRIVFRKISQTLGLRVMTVLGLSSLACSLILYLIVNSPATLILPAAAAGISHAFLFPAVMAAGANRFSTQYRGLAMSLMFALFDCGLFVGAPLMGLFLSTSQQLQLPAYPVTFAAFFGWVMFVTTWYGYAKLRESKMKKLAG